MARFLITSALPYINGVKHLGNLAGSMLPADVHARFRRLQGHEVLFICGTDEHGTPAELAAAESNLGVRAYCDEQHVLQRTCAEEFALSFDFFGRSSSRQNRDLTQLFAARLEDRGYIKEKETKQVYSVDDRRFLPDRYIEGTCPSCGYDRARGDQCDGCGTLLDPVDLIRPHSVVSGSTSIEIKSTKHLFLLQSKLAEPIRKWVDGAQGWPALAKSIAYKWLDEGLQDRSITRDLSWGVPVSRDGFVRPGYEHKVFYVWFDAPIEYIGATQEWAQATGADWARWWRVDQGAQDVSYIQFMGKDNVAFHTVSFPATIIGAGEPFKLVDRLKAFNWVNWYGGKFSTSQQRGIFMDQALKLLPADYWRWYLTAHAPESSDTAFTLEHFQAVVNSDLANVLGNFANRILHFIKVNFDGCVPSSRDFDDQVWIDVASKLGALTGAHDAMEYRRAAVETRAIWSLGNEFLQERAPWTTIKVDRTRAGADIATAAMLLRLAATISLPIIPTTATTILRSLGLNVADARWPNNSNPQADLSIHAGAAATVPNILFQKIDDETVAKWKAQFLPEQSDVRTS
jgi:methionyl-tRNA synthetase